MKMRSLLFAVCLCALSAPLLAGPDEDLVATMTKICQEQGKVFDGVKDCIEPRDIKIDERCDTLECMLSQKTQSAVYKQVVQKYGTGSGRCLAGVKRLLANVLGAQWMTGTRHARQYLAVIRNSKEFNEIGCIRDKIAEYPDGTLFIFDTRPDCRSNNQTPGGSSCSYSGHIMVKISDTQEFAGQKEPLTRWSPYFGDKCYAFMLADAVVLDNTPDGSGDNNVCFLPNADNMPALFVPAPLNLNELGG